MTYQDEKRFRDGRLAWLKSMLERDSIFVSGMFDDLEEHAVENIKQEIRMLENDQ